LRAGFLPLVGMTVTRSDEAQIGNRTGTDGASATRCRERAELLVALSYFAYLVWRGLLRRTFVSTAAADRRGHDVRRQFTVFR